MIPAQAVRYLLYREAAHEHVTQLVQLRIRPFPAGVRVRAMIDHLPKSTMIPSLPSGHDYRLLARQIRDIARQTRLTVAEH